LINVSEIVAAIRGHKARPERQIFVAGIFGWPAEDTGALYACPCSWSTSHERQIRRRKCCGTSSPW
jgi:hypothetical protein